MTDEFDFTAEVDVRFQDLDVAGHVNNAVYATYVEQARIDYLRNLVGDSLMDGGPVIASLEIDFQRSVQLGTESVAVDVRVSDLGTSSIRMAYRVRSEAGTAATAETVLVTTEEGEPAPLPDQWREAIAEFEGIDPGE